MKVALHGATGRMGLTVARLAASDDGVTIVGAACAPDDPGVGRDLGELSGVGAVGVTCSGDVGASLLGADVVIDFSVAGAVRELLTHASRGGVAVVSGTTNLDVDVRAALDRAAERVAVLWAPNMSMGVQVLCEIAEHALARLGPDYDIEIVEVHHRRKIDAPSGTAVRLAEVVRRVRGESRTVSGREGSVGARRDDELGVLAVRGGDVVGDHTVHLLGPSERLELTHRAISRDLFARGALRAARFLVGRKPGRYGIADVLSG